MILQKSFLNDIICFAAQETILIIINVETVMNLNILLFYYYKKNQDSLMNRKFIYIYIYIYICVCVSTVLTNYIYFYSF